MATITKRNDSYRIKVSCGYDIHGKQITQSITWIPDDTLKPNQIKKELCRQAVLFEEACNKGFVTSCVKFETFAEQWFEEYAKPRYKATTYDKLRNVKKRVNTEIGHLRIDKISTRTIQQVICNFTKGNAKKGYKALSPKTIKNSISFISSVLDYGIRLGLVNENPCDKALLPTASTPDKEVYSLAEMQLFLDTLINDAPLNYQIFFILAVYGGFRLGEILGLTWDNIDFEINIIHIRKTANHIVGQGIVFETPKTIKSIRSLRLPDVVFAYLDKLKRYYNDQSIKLGSKWVDDNDSVIKAWNGAQLSPLTPDSWLRRFCQRNKLRFVSIHSFRHFNATLLINSGIDVKTVQSCLGHAQASTTLNIYAHSFIESQAKASQIVAEKFSLLK